MAKTTKVIRGIHSWIKFQRHQGLQSLTIKGKESLADLSQDKNGDTDLILNADKDKVNNLNSSVSYLAIAHTTTGTAPNQEKSATISQDLTQFPITSGELVTVTKDTESLTIRDDKIKEFVNTTVATELGKLGHSPETPPTSNGFGVSTTVLGGIKYETGTNTRIFELEAHEVDMFTDNERNFLEISFDNGNGSPITTHIVRGEKELDFDGVSIKIYKKDGKLKMKIKGSETLGEEAILYFKLFHTGYLKGLQLAFTGGEGEDPEITVVEPTVPSVPQPLPSRPPQ